MKKKLLCEFTKRLADAEEYVNFQLSLSEAGYVMDNDVNKKVLADAGNLYCILDFLYKSGVCKTKKYAKYKTRIQEFEHWFLPVPVNGDCFM